MTSTTITVATVGRCKGVNFNCGRSALRLIVVAKIDVEGLVRHSWRIDQETVKSVKVGTLPLRAVDRWFWPVGELSLQEALHFRGVLEAEARVRLQSDENVVGVYCGRARLVQGKQIDDSTRAVVWCGRSGSGGSEGSGGSGSGSRSGILEANRWLPRAAPVVLQLAANAASGIAQARITSLIAQNKAVTAGRCAHSLWVGRIAVGGAGEALGGGRAGFACTWTIEATLCAVEVLRGVAGDWFQDQLLANPIGVLVVPIRTAAGTDLAVKDRI